MSPDREPLDFEVLPPAKGHDGAKFSRVLAWVLDDLIPIPGTRMRVGLDPIIGLIPGVGDSSAAVFGSVIIVNAVRAGVPRVVLVRMGLNVMVNTIFGTVPVLGDLFSAWFKSNNRNYALLLKHSGTGRKSTRADWAVVIGLLVVLLGFVIGVSLLVAWMVIQFFRLLAGA